MIRRRFIPLAAATALALALPTGFQQAAHADSDKGYAFGSVIDSTTGAPIPFADVDIYRQSTTDPTDWIDVGGATANRLGQFIVSSTVGGNYKISAGAAGYTYTVYGGTFDEDTTGATFPLYVGANAPAPTIGLSPEPAPTTPLTGTLGGTVVDHRGAPYAGVWVTAYDATTKQVQDWAQTDRSGRYIFTDLDPNKLVKLQFEAMDAAAEWYNDKTSFATGDVVAAGPSETATPPQAGTVTLDRVGVGTITGNVKVPLVAGNAWRADACAYSVTGETWTCADTDAAGNYTMDLPAGVYYIKARGENAAWDAVAGEDKGNWPFVGAYVGKKAKKPSFATAGAKPITVTHGATTSKVNIVLNRNIKNLVKPWISGKKLKKGKTLTAHPGVWNTSELDYEITWKLGKKTLGVGPEYTLTKKSAKKAKRIKITVVAMDSNTAYDTSTDYTYGPLIPGKAKSKGAGSPKPELDFTAKGGKKGGKKKR